MIPKNLVPPVLRKRRAIAVALALLVPFAQIATVAHFTAHGHHWCAEHAAVEHHEPAEDAGGCCGAPPPKATCADEDDHAHGSHSHADSPRESSPTPHAPALREGQAVEGHHACPIPTAVREGQGVSEIAGTEDAGSAESGRHARLEVLARTGLSPILFAPKQSPPLA